MPEAPSYAVSSELWLSNQRRALSSPAAQRWRPQGPRRPNIHQRCHVSGWAGGSSISCPSATEDTDVLRGHTTEKPCVHLIHLGKWPDRPSLPSVCTDGPPCTRGHSREKRQVTLKCHILLKAWPQIPWPKVRPPLSSHSSVLPPPISYLLPRIRLIPNSAAENGKHLWSHSSWDTSTTA